MEEERDFLKLSIEERCQHKLWKARVNGYEDASKLFSQQDDAKSLEFDKYLSLLMKFVEDNNAVAQEKGLMAVLSFVKNAECSPRVVNEIMSGLVNKCFSSPRAKTRELALEITLTYIEIGKQDAVLKELIKGLENKSPKVVSNCIINLRRALHLFGSEVIWLKPLVKVLPKLLEDRDKGIRLESKHLCVEIYRWIGDALKTQLQSVKAVALSELESEFQNTVGERVVPTRYLKSQLKKIVKVKEKNDAVEVETDEALVPPAVVYSFDLMTAVDVLSKLPDNFYEQCEAKKWQERKEVLEILLQLTANVKLESGDYGDLVRAMKIFITKDSNVVVVGLAFKCLCNLIQGLRKKFKPYVSEMNPAIFEKFKEKKQNVVVPLRKTIDELCSIYGFEVMLEDTQSALNNKNPRIKAETCSFLSRAFATFTSAQLNKKLLKALTASLIKSLNDTDGNVRENAAEALGTALKVAGEHVMSNLLQEVDPIKMTKIKDFCDKAETKQPVSVEMKPECAPAIVKRTPVERKNSLPEPSKHEPVKQTAKGIKKSVSSSPAKSKRNNSAVRFRASGDINRNRVDAGQPEFKENELSDNDVLAQVSEILTDDVVIIGLGSSNWRDRLAACEKLFETIQTIEKGCLPAQCLVKLLAKSPGFKENNFQILKLRLEMLTYIVENAQISHVTVECCLSDVVNKIGDVKNGVHAGSALTALAGATNLEYISFEVLNLAFNQKSTKNQSETLMWVSNAIEQFGLKVKVKEITDILKKAFSSTDPGVRKAALALAGTMYLYVGKSFRSFFKDEKPALLQQIDSVFEKMDSEPPAPAKGKSTKVDGDATEIPEQVKLSSLMPTVDISSQITSQLLLDLSDNDWHIRSDALQKISILISDAEFVSPNLGELPLALITRLADSNKKLALQALNVCQMLGTSLGGQCFKRIQNFAPGILACLGDNKGNIRAAAVQCLNSWMDNCPLINLFQGGIVYDVLQTDNTLLRIELFSWLTEKLPTVASLTSDELTHCVPILLNCIEDRNPDVRKKAVDCLLPFMIHVGYESMARAASKMKPASKENVLDHLEKVRQILPDKTTAKSKSSKNVSPPDDSFSHPQISSNYERGKNKSSFITSKSKFDLKSLDERTSIAKIDEKIDTSPSLLVNNMKDQRLADEKALRVLKWNFTNPTKIYYVQLQDQMTAADWNKTLISHCFHNDFKFHIKAIDLLIESLSNDVKASSDNLDLILKWLSLIFLDTNPSVLIKSLEYLQLLFQALTGINYRMLDFEAASFVPYLILNIGDPKVAVRKGLRRVIKGITLTYPFSKMFSYIMQGLASKNARQRSGCLEELGHMIAIYGLDVCQPSPEVALEEIAKKISDRDNSVRTAALDCVVQAYLIEGEKVYKYVGQLSDEDLSYISGAIDKN